jgi:hypothetical protein
LVKRNKNEGEKLQGCSPFQSQQTVVGTGRIQPHFHHNWGITCSHGEAIRRGKQNSVSQKIHPKKHPKKNPKGVLS